MRSRSLPYNLIKLCHCNPQKNCSKTASLKSIITLLKITKFPAQKEAVHQSSIISFLNRRSHQTHLHKLILYLLSTIVIDLYEFPCNFLQVYFSKPANLILIKSWCALSYWKIKFLFPLIKTIKKFTFILDYSKAYITWFGIKLKYLSKWVLNWL